MLAAGWSPGGCPHVLCYESGRRKERGGLVDFERLNP